jgi:hypothetical protein
VANPRVPPEPYAEDFHQSGHQEVLGGQKKLRMEKTGQVADRTQKKVQTELASAAAASRVSLFGDLERGLRV